MAKVKMAGDTGNMKIPTNEYPPNSNTSKKNTKNEKAVKATDDNEREIRRVVKKKATMKKKSLGSKVAETFVGDDVADVKEYIIFDVLIPAIKNIVVDSVTSGVNMLLFGNSERKPTNIHRDGGYSRVSYGSYYDKPSRSNRHQGTSVIRTIDFEQMIFDSRVDAESVLDEMADIVARYNFVSVADVCTMTGVESRYTYNNYGWTDVSAGYVKRVRDGYIIDLPSPRPFD